MSHLDCHAVPAGLQIRLTLGDAVGEGGRQDAQNLGTEASGKERDRDAAEAQRDLRQAGRVGGPGAVEERLIMDASVSSGVLTLTLNRPYTGDDIPNPAESDYQIIVDDAVRGRLGYDTGGSVDPIGDVFEEVVAVEVFDDRTFVNIGTKATDDSTVTVRPRRSSTLTRSFSPARPAIRTSTGRRNRMLSP